MAHLKKLGRVLQKPEAAAEPKGFVPTSITLPVEMLAEVQRIGLERKLAKQSGTTVSAIIREALTAWLEDRQGGR